MKSVLAIYPLLFAFVTFCSGQSFDGKPGTEVDPLVKEFLSQPDADDPEQVETVLFTVSNLGYSG